MKKSFFFIFAVTAYNLGFGQTNPVQNLVWIHYYDWQFNYNILSLSWEEPKMPHNTLIGYNIYRENELYKFQTKNSLGCNPNSSGPPAEATEGCGFEYYNGGGPFTGYVAAVYEGGAESEYVSFECGGALLDVTNPSLKLKNIFPNPAKDNLNFSEEVSNVTITDLSGRIVKQIPTSGKTVDVSKLAKGIYIINATTKSGRIISQKLVKE